MELPAVGPTAINLTFSDGNVAPLTEAGARVFLAGLRAEIADAAQDGCDIAFELQDSTSSTEVTMSLGRARAFADDIKVMLSRFAARTGMSQTCCAARTKRLSTWWPARASSTM